MARLAAGDLVLRTANYPSDGEWRDVNELAPFRWTRTRFVSAFLVFSISVVSFPMLYERDIDFVTAMVTSVRLVMANSTTMIIWFVVIGVLMGISLLSGFLGLIFVLPVLGHATWHLYRRAVEPAVAGGAVAASRGREAWRCSGFRSVGQFSSGVDSVTNALSRGFAAC